MDDTLQLVILGGTTILFTARTPRRKAAVKGHRLLAIHV